MTRNIEMGDLFEEVEIGMWGQHYEVLLATSQVEAKVSPLAAAVIAAENMKPEIKGEGEGDLDLFTDEQRLKMAEAYADAIDAVVKPVDNGAEGSTKGPRARTHLLKLYKANKLGVVHLEGAFQQVFDAYQGRNRPTQSSPEQNGTTSE